MLNRFRFRTWWQPARKASELHDERAVSFLELFYDLVYVVLVAQLSHALAANLDFKHLWQFIFLFAIVFWSWLNGTTYHEYHGNNDIRTRIFTFLQMFAVAGMAVFAHSAMAEGSRGFAFFYGVFQVILGYLWWRLAVHDPEHHRANRFYVIFFSLSTLLFFISIFVDTPLRFYLWGVAVLMTLLQPFFMFVRRPLVRQSSSPIHFSPALVERFGLFNILVLAEIVVGVVTGLSHHEHLSTSTFIVGGLGLSIAIAMWWLYFDFVSHRIPLSGQTPGAVWLYLHLFVSMSIVATAAAVLNVVEHAGEALAVDVRWMLVASVAVYLLSLVPLMGVVSIQEELKPGYRQGRIMLFLAALVIVLLGFSKLASPPLLMLIVLFMMVPVVYAVIFWVQVLDARALQRH